jgi:hypothetical protein
MSEPGDAEPDERTESDEPVLPDLTSDERGEGWGEDRDGRRDEQWYRHERPPHHE